MSPRTQNYRARLLVTIACLTPSLAACDGAGPAGEPPDRVSFQLARTESANGGHTEGVATVAVTYGPLDDERRIRMSADDLESAGATAASFSATDELTGGTLQAAVNDDLNEVTFNDGAGAVQVRLYDEARGAIVRADGSTEPLSTEQIAARLMQTLTVARNSPQSFVAIDELIQSDNNPAVSLGFKSFFKRLFGGLRRVVKVVAKPFVEIFRRALDIVLPAPATPPPVP